MRTCQLALPTVRSYCEHCGGGTSVRLSTNPRPRHSVPLTAPPAPCDPLSSPSPRRQLSLRSLSCSCSLSVSPRSATSQSSLSAAGSEWLLTLRRLCCSSGCTTSLTRPLRGGPLHRTTPYTVRDSSSLLAAPSPPSGSSPLQAAT